MLQEELAKIRNEKEVLMTTSVAVCEGKLKVHDVKKKIDVVICSQIGCDYQSSGNITSSF